MDKKLSIKVGVAGRSYPLNIDRSQEEVIRKAAKMIDEKVMQYKQRYKDKDTQDFLAMASLQYVIKVLELENKADVAPVYNELKAMERELSEFLEKE
ncbi:cell division protein ZapA [Marinifilum sp. N1E240]|uniref:cell division protein ZapA n=1 Tax=Marinifilum sp. N1E240 TaxID=2608082 RepID=UPI00128DF4E5|nr:cell division protein ZapA [Marinifilum sp. N1E240]MPQ46575.1 cell division protein ZapA [Marinifilum sp. N1E240]